MCNCNGQRAAYTASLERPRDGEVRVSLIEDKPVILNGNITGRIYAFRNINDANWVDKRDAAYMEKIEGLIIGV